MISPSTRDDPAGQCIGKERFTDKALADRVAHQVAHRHDGGIGPYKCPHCSGWHIGSRSRKNINRGK